MFTRGESQPRYSSYTEVTKIVQRVVSQSPHGNERDVQKHWCCVTFVSVFVYLSMHINKAVSGAHEWPPDTQSRGPSCCSRFVINFNLLFYLRPG